MALTVIASTGRPTVPHWPQPTERSFERGSGQQQSAMLTVSTVERTPESSAKSEYRSRLSTTSGARQRRAKKQEACVAEHVPVIVITGNMGAGKTTILAEASDLLTAGGIVHAAIDLDTLK